MLAVEALELFKKSLPGPGESFLQTGSHSSARARARVLIKAAQDASSRVLGQGTSSALLSQFMQLALSGKKAGFEKIIKMMDDFVGTLKKEQAPSMLCEFVEGLALQRGAVHLLRAGVVSSSVVLRSTTMSRKLTVRCRGLALCFSPPRPHSGSWARLQGR